MLIGPPCVGKSLWTEDAFRHFNIKPFIVSKDKIVEEVAEEYDLSYFDMFQKPPAGSPISDVHHKFGTIVDTGNGNLVYERIAAARNQIEWRYKQRLKKAPGNEVIVIDRTNMNKHSRSESFSCLQNHFFSYKKIAVIFMFEGAENYIKKVSEKRQKKCEKMGKNKRIPMHVFDHMFSSYEEPKKEEGFDKIIYIDNRMLLESIAKAPSEDVRIEQ